MQSGKSLIYRRNKRGPRTVPCGTPEDTGIEEEQVPLRTTCSVRIDLSIGVFFLGCHTIEVCKAASDVGRCRRPFRSQEILDWFGYRYHNLEIGLEITR